MAVCVPWQFRRKATHQGPRPRTGFWT